MPMNSTTVITTWVFSLSRNRSSSSGAGDESDFTTAQTEKSKRIQIKASFKSFIKKSLSLIRWKNYEKIFENIEKFKIKKKIESTNPKHEHPGAIWISTIGGGGGGVGTDELADNADSEEQLHCPVDVVKVAKQCSKFFSKCCCPLSLLVLVWY